MTETDPVYETLCFLVSRIPDEGPSNSECYTPQSEPFSVYYELIRVKSPYFG
jgi:hypothetical protein